MITSTSQQRFHGLDALRAFALFLGIVLHSCMSFMPNSEYFWLVHDQSRSLFSGLLFYCIHVFRMTLFFLLAGFFCQTMLAKKGMHQFIKDRAKRILVPLIVGWPIIFTLFVCAIVYATWVKNNGTLPKNPAASPRFTPDDFPLAHLWFLYLLVLFYVIYLAAYGTLGRYATQIQNHAIFVKASAVLCSWIGPFILALPVSSVLFYTPYWIAWFGIPTPDRSLYPNFAAITGFGTAFCFGGILAAKHGLWKQWVEHWPRFALFSIILLALSCSRVGVTPSLIPAAHGTDKWINAWLYCSATWCTCFCLVGLFSSLFTKFNAYLRYLADASYWVYLIHLPIVIVLQAMLSRLDLPAAVKLPMIIIICCAISLPTYRLFVRYTIIGRVLNGSRKKKTQIENER